MPRRPSPSLLLASSQPSPTASGWIIPSACCSRDSTFRMPYRTCFPPPARPHLCATQTYCMCESPGLPPSPSLARNWFGPELRPFGRRLPANCPECGCMDSFARPIKLTPKGSTKYVFVCDGTNIAGKECLHELTVEPMDGFEPYGRSQNGARWMLRTEQVSI